MQYLDANIPKLYKINETYLKELNFIIAYSFVKSRQRLQLLYTLPSKKIPFFETVFPNIKEIIAFSKKTDMKISKNKNWFPIHINPMAPPPFNTHMNMHINTHKSYFNKKKKRVRFS
tara:strand:- start:1218 stop:1568 length:351 start_codon:yes stop_codon:yes gene_type:complete